MTRAFHAGLNTTFIGSLPVSDPEHAVDLMMAHAPRVPVWPQLPVYPEEGMMAQFCTGLPGHGGDPGHLVLETDGAAFDAALLAFYEAYMDSTARWPEMVDPRFTLRPEIARGFHALCRRLSSQAPPLLAVKGQVTGPFSLGTAIKDARRRPIFFDPQLRDAVVKLLSLNARWQIRTLAQAAGAPVILFIDEPGLAGFGSSAFISVSRQDITDCLAEVVAAIHAEGALAGVHVCANTDWGLIIDTGMDVINFDAYAYFDRFVLYPEQIRTFFDAGKILAWGIVPTLVPEDIAAASVASLTARWEAQALALERIGVPRRRLVDQVLITPACGTGARTPAEARRILELTAGVSAALQAKYLS